MKPGKAVPLSLAQEAKKWIAPWDELRRKHDLGRPGLANSSASPSSMPITRCATARCSRPASIVSTVKINQAGFTEMMDTEAMFKKWFAEAKAIRLLP
jgi:hypothetical protein